VFTAPRVVLISLLTYKAVLAMIQPKVLLYKNYNLFNSLNEFMHLQILTLIFVGYAGLKVENP
jgi:hypothetical protein